MLRKQYIELVRRQIYGGQPTDDAEITVNLVNLWLDMGIAAAAEKNYYDNQKLDGIAYVNNSFYTTFKGLPITADEKFVWQIEMPQIPVGIGASEGISTLKLKDSQGYLSYPVIWLTINQVSFYRSMRKIPNKILAYSEGKYVYILTPMLIDNCTATVTMVSGGNRSDLDSVINVPDDYLPFVTEYIKQQLQFERAQPVDVPDGADFVKTV